jgi:hypothetical protein
MRLVFFGLWISAKIAFDCAHPVPVALSPTGASFVAQVRACSDDRDSAPKASGQARIRKDQSPTIPALAEMTRSIPGNLVFTQDKLGFGMNTILEIRLTILSNTSLFPVVPGGCKVRGRALLQ